MGSGGKRPRPALESFLEHLQLLAQVEMPPRLRGHVEPADAAQQTIVKALQKWDQFRGETEIELMCWLRSILLHHLTDIARTFDRRQGDKHHSLDSSRVRGVFEVPAQQSSPSHRAMQQERFSQLSKAVAALPSDEKRAVQLRHLNGLHVAEISRQMGRSQQSVAGLLRRALSRLREELDFSL
jgi:RNA polymerase sigma-70 factor, ECF subfamily